MLWLIAKDVCFFFAHFLANKIDKKEKGEEKKCEEYICCLVAVLKELLLVLLLLLLLIKVQGKKIQLRSVISYSSFHVPLMDTYSCFFLTVQSVSVLCHQIKKKKFVRFSF